MQPTERGVNPHINHIIENSGNFINFFAHKEHEKEHVHNLFTINFSCVRLVE